MRRYTYFGIALASIGLVCSTFAVGPESDTSDSITPSTSEGVSYNDLPDEIHALTLLCLERGDIAKCNAVCKKWHKIGSSVLNVRNAKKHFDEIIEQVKKFTEELAKIGLEIYNCELLPCIDYSSGSEEESEFPCHRNSRSFFNGWDRFGQGDDGAGAFIATGGLSCSLASLPEGHGDSIFEGSPPLGASDFLDPSNFSKWDCSKPFVISEEEGEFSQEPRLSDIDKIFQIHANVVSLLRSIEAAEACQEGKLSILDCELIFSKLSKCEELKEYYWQLYEAMWRVNPEGKDILKSLVTSTKSAHPVRRATTILMSLPLPMIVLNKMERIGILGISDIAHIAEEFVPAGEKVLLEDCKLDSETASMCLLKYALSYQLPDDDGEVSRSLFDELLKSPHVKLGECMPYFFYLLADDKYFSSQICVQKLIWALKVYGYEKSFEIIKSMVDGYNKQDLYNALLNADDLLEVLHKQINDDLLRLREALDVDPGCPHHVIRWSAEGALEEKEEYKKGW